MDKICEYVRIIRRCACHYSDLSAGIPEGIGHGHPPQEGRSAPNGVPFSYNKLLRGLRWPVHAWPVRIAADMAPGEILRSEQKLACVAPQLPWVARCFPKMLLRPKGDGARRVQAT
jgi:hypothetical protein